MAFADSFTFTRAGQAPYLDDTGAQQVAAVDAPRFDHYPTGAPRGLLIQGLADGQPPDVAEVIDGGWSAPQNTILSEQETPAGQVIRRALYSRDAVTTLNALLSEEGWQRQVIVFPAYLRNTSGSVFYGGFAWTLPEEIDADADDAVAADPNIPLLES